MNGLTFTKINYENIIKPLSETRTSQYYKPIVNH